MKRSSSCRESGYSLLEMLFVVAVLGTTVVLLAPLDHFLLDTLRRVRHARTAGGDLALSASLLTMDARAASRHGADGAGSVRLLLPGGNEIVWRETMHGLERCRVVDGRQVARRAFRGVRRLRPGNSSAGLLSLTLEATDGRTRLVTSRLRNARTGSMKRDSQRGAVLIHSIVFICLLSSTVTLVTAPIVGRGRAVQLRHQRAQAFYAAEAGIARGVAELTLHPAPHLALEARIGGAVYRVVAETDALGIVTIRSTGGYAGLESRLTVRGEHSGGAFALQRWEPGDGDVDRALFADTSP